MEASYDIKKDYYKILGVEITATADELKAAHVKLALKHHPDMQVTEITQSSHLNISTNENGLNFHEISEAWGVLSKPEIRKSYDRDRNLLLSPFGSEIPLSSFHSVTDHHITTSFASSRENYTQAVKKNASSNWRDLQDKYKMDKWRNSSLQHKKDFRARPVKSLTGMGISAFMIGLPILGVCIWTFRSLSKADYNKSNSYINSRS